MNIETRSLLQSLQAADLFAKCGERIESDLLEDVLRPSSWQVAMDMCASTQWQNVQIHYQNRLTTHLGRNHRPRFQRWNQIVGEIKTAFSPWLSRRTEAVGRAHRLPTNFTHAVEWDVLGACMESEHADVSPTRFFRDLMTWYLAGHFPCGLGIITDAGKLRLVEPETDPDVDLDPEREDFLLAAVRQPIAMAVNEMPPEPAGRVVVY